MLTVSESPIRNHTKEKIVAELKHLEWYKMANESALKAALKQAKSLKKTSSNQSTLHTIEFHSENTVIQKVEQSDLKSFVFDVEEKEKTNNSKLSNQIELHINVLNRLRAKLDEQEEVKMRSHQYRQWKKEFSKKKEYVMEGKKLENYLPQHTSTASLQMNERQDIPDSLKKLAELEARISVFENACNTVTNDSDTVYEKLVMFQKQHKPLKGAGGIIIEKRMNGLNGRKANRFDEKNSSKNNIFKPKFAQHYLDKASLEKKRISFKKKGFFLTECDNEYNDDDNDRKSILRENRRKMAMASEGQKNLRMRIQQRKARVNALPYARGSRAIEQPKRSNVPSSMARSTGASTGNKSNNRYLNEFERIKTEYSRKREESKVRNGILNNNKPQDLNHANKNYLSINILNERMKNQNLLMSQSAGSVTRKLESNTLPLRRPVSMSLNNQQQQPSLTSFSVLGVNGIRKLKNK